MDKLQVAACPPMDRVFPYPQLMSAKALDGEEEEELAVCDTARVLAANVRSLMQAHKELGSNPKLGKKTGLGASGISRLINGQNATLGSVERVARAFNVEPWHLLVPGFDPKRLPTLSPVSEGELALYARIAQAVAKEMKQEH
jgi:transcriptional regulator with XRE-family HTH domain